MTIDARPGASTPHRTNGPTAGPTTGPTAGRVSVRSSGGTLNRRGARASRLLPSVCLALGLIGLGHGAHAQESAAGQPAAAEGVAEAAAPDLDAVRARIEKSLPGMQATSVRVTPVAGLFEAIIDGTVYYVDESGEYLFDGSLVKLSTRENLTEARMGTLHMAALAGLDAGKMLTYTPEKPTGRFVTVFTDISCGYCRKLHADIDTLLDAGVAVNYLLFPRAGLGSEGDAALESVWCNADPQAAMTTAKTGGRVPDATCDNPIEEHVALAQQVGLRGTPLIYTDAGERIPGYREPAALVEMIEASEPWTAP